MPGSKYLSCRCTPNTFTTNVTPLLNRLSEESIEALRDAHLLPLFRMPTIPQNIPMLYVLLRLYNREKEAFQLGNYLLKMTVNEVTLILGLPNAGLRFTFSRSPVVDKTHKSLTEEIHRAADEEGSPMVEGRRLCMLVKYLLVMFFFPLKSLKVPSCINKITCLPEFVKYNWPLAIHEFLHLQFDHLSRVSVIRNAGSNIGFFEGCTTVLLVKKKFMNVLDKEKFLLGEEDDDSDFETLLLRKDKRRRFFIGSDYTAVIVHFHTGLKALQDDVPVTFPDGFVNWSVEDAVVLPKQDNSWDCGAWALVPPLADISSTYQKKGHEKQSYRSKVKGITNIDTNLQKKNTLDLSIQELGFRHFFRQELRKKMYDYER
ncbi:hypothetical protein KSP40_PGU015237 [Platanthera guangdongensis]|uniref:Ubiquitin-like protease family profile domain-containing protein n=1 Tax=Platanthera guangdongensis TaxID=2320717 RepID=A0ABR2M431_9ASPA